MPGAFVIDLTHYLDVLDPAVEVPPEARRFAEYLGRIVGAATGRALDPGDVRYSALPCRRRPGRKPCTGQLVIALSKDPAGIRWGCSKCDDEGLIYNYRGTPWDLTGALDKYDGPTIAARTDRPKYRAALGEHFLDPALEALVLGAEVGDRAVWVVGPEDAMEELAGNLAGATRDRSGSKLAEDLDEFYWAIEKALQDAKKARRQGKVTWLPGRRER